MPSDLLVVLDGDLARALIQHMAIRTHRRRKIHIDGRDFVWHANDEWTMHVASVDKRFVVSIPVLFPPFPPWDEAAVDHLPVLVSGH